MGGLDQSGTVDMEKRKGPELYFGDRTVDGPKCGDGQEEGGPQFLSIRTNMYHKKGSLHPHEQTNSSDDGPSGSTKKFLKSIHFL